MASRQETVYKVNLDLTWFTTYIVGLRLIRLMYLVVTIVNQVDFFGWLRTGLAGGIGSAVVPVEAMSVVIFSLVAEFTSGFAAAGALLDAGILTIRETGGRARRGFKRGDTDFEGGMLVCNGVGDLSS